LTSRTIVGTKFWHARKGRDEGVRVAFPAAPKKKRESDLESAAFMFHMTGVNPESSGLRELRVL
jgi:hypothetical protein